MITKRINQSFYRIKGGEREAHKQFQGKQNKLQAFMLICLQFVG